MEELDACRKTDGERVASAAWTGIARAFASEGTVAVTGYGFILYCKCTLGE